MLCLRYFFFAALSLAQRALCAAAILFLPAADILRRGFLAVFDVFLLVPPNNFMTVCIASMFC